MIINSTFIGGGALQIGDITSKNKSGDSNFALCDGKTIYYQYYPELYNTNYIMNGLGKSNSQNIGGYGFYTYEINSKYYPWNGCFRVIEDKYLINVYTTSSSRYQLVPINNITSGTTTASQTSQTIRKFKDLYVSITTYNSSASYRRVAYRKNLEDSDTNASPTLTPNYLFNTDEAVLAVNNSSYPYSVYYSSDGINYKQLSSEKKIIRCNEKYFLELTGSADAKYSKNGADWYDCTLPISASDATAFEGVFFIKDSNNIAYASVDCVNWDEIGAVNNLEPYTSYQTTRGSSTSPNEDAFYCLSYVNGKYFIRRTADIVWTEDFVDFTVCDYFVTAYHAGKYFSERGYSSVDLTNWTAPTVSGFRLGVYNSEGILFAVDYSTYTGEAQSQTRGNRYYSANGIDWVLLGSVNGATPYFSLSAGGYIFNINNSSSYSTSYAEINYSFPNYSDPHYMKVK